MLIKDNLFHGYEINTCSGGGLEVRKPSTLNAKGKQNYTNHGYHSTVESAVSSIIKLVILDKYEEQTITLQEYVNELRGLKDSIYNSVQFNKI